MTELEWIVAIVGKGSATHWAREIDGVLTTKCGRTRNVRELELASPAPVVCIACRGTQHPRWK